MVPRTCEIPGNIVRNERVMPILNSPVRKGMTGISEYHQAGIMEVANEM
jgi:hypothetical protein